MSLESCCFLSPLAVMMIIRLNLANFSRSVPLVSMLSKTTCSAVAKDKPAVNFTGYGKKRGCAYLDTPSLYVLIWPFSRKRLLIEEVVDVFFGEVANDNNHRAMAFLDSADDEFVRFAFVCENKHIITSRRMTGH